MIALRAYLLLGLVAHKLLWEVLRHRAGRRRQDSANPGLQAVAVKFIKLAILAAVLVQTAVSVDVLPIVTEPSRLRIVGAILYSAGLLIAMSARIQLGRNWTDIESADVLSEHAVVERGIYRYIRHPIYVGDLLLLVGLELALNSWLVLPALLLIPPVLWKAIREERMLATQLPGYADYCVRTKRFVPFLI